jgi:hypothetical protein
VVDVNDQSLTAIQRFGISPSAASFGTPVKQLLGQAVMSGIHCQELGIWQYVQGKPQAGVGIAVGKCLTIRPLACERATPAMIHRPSLSS